MKKTRIPGLLLLAALVVAQDAPKAKAKAPTLPQMTDDQFVAQWLAQDCFVGEGGAIFKEIRRRGAGLEPLFLAAMDQQIDFTELEREWERRWKASRKLLDEGEDFGLRPAQLARVRHDSLAAFKARAKERFTKARFNAILSGLLYVGTKVSLRRLTPLSQTAPDDRFLNATMRAIRARQ